MIQTAIELSAFVEFVARFVFLRVFVVDMLGGLNVISAAYCGQFRQLYLTRY